MAISAFNSFGIVPFGDYHLVWEPNNPKISPHRDFMRGSSLTIDTAETGAVDTAYIYGYVVLPANLPSFNNIRIIVACKRWNYFLTYGTVYFKTYVDRIPRIGPGIPLSSGAMGRVQSSSPSSGLIQPPVGADSTMFDDTGQVRGHNLIRDEISDAAIYSYDDTPWDPGDIILVTSSVYNVRNDEKFAIHNMYLAYGETVYI